MKVNKFLTTIWYLLAISFLLWIIWNTTGVNRYFDKKTVGTFDNTPNTDLVIKNRKKRKKRKFLYDDPIDFEFVGEKIIDNDEIDYELFIEIIKTNDFIENYKEALRINYYERLDRYNKILRDLNISAVQSISPNQSSNQKRAKERTKLIEEVISTLNSSIKELNSIKIRSDFIDMIEDEDHGFASLVGREEVKEKIIKTIVAFSRDPVAFISGFQNMAIYGKSGTGKTKLAESIGFIYAKTGILSRRRYRKISSEDILSSYANEQGSLTRDAYYSCFEGVLFLDEAYELAPSRGMHNTVTDSQKKQAITEFVNLTGDHGGLCILIVGGYKKKMEKYFMNSNEGLDRRFRHKITLENYNSKQLTDILIQFFYSDTANIKIAEQDANILYGIVDNLNKRNVFDRQAGDIHNMVTFITESINSTIKVWGENYITNYNIIASGVNEFLDSKKKKFFIPKLEN